MKLRKYWELIKFPKMPEAVRNKVIRYFGEFMLFMLICTIISRGIYVNSLAEVTTQTPKRMSVNHIIEADGVVDKQSESAITVLSGIRVEKVFVNTGELIKEKDALFQLDREDLEEQIREIQYELDKLNLQIQELEKEKQLSIEDDNKELARANEDAARVVQENDALINNSLGELTGAKNTLSNLGSEEEYCTSAINNSAEIKSAQEQVNQLENEINGLKEQRNQLENKDSDAADQADSNIVEAANLDGQISLKEEELSEANRKLESLKAGVTETAKGEWAQQKTELEAAIKAKQEAYENAVDAKADALLEANRNLEDASGKEITDTTLDSTRLDREQKEEVLKKYQELQKTDGLIYSDKEGMITKLSVSPGESTPEGASVLVADKSEVLKFTAAISKEQQKMLKVGDKAAITFAAEDLKLEDLVISSIEDSPEEPDTCVLCINVPAEKVTIGMSGSMEIEKQSESYSACVPLEALHADGSQNYVLVLESKNTIMGEEYYVERRNVAIADKNDKYAALDQSALSQEEKIIVSSSKYIGGGETVRLQEP